MNRVLHDQLAFADAVGFNEPWIAGVANEIRELVVSDSEARSNLLRNAPEIKLGAGRCL